MVCYLKIWISMLLVAVLAACGGGGNPGSSTAPAATVPTVVAIELFASATTLNSADNTTGVTITAIAKNASNVGVSSQIIVFSANSGILGSVAAASNSAGTSSAVLTTGSDHSNRNITVTATVGAVSKTLVIPVVGSTMTVNGSSSLVSGASATYVVSLKDSGGGAISAANVSISSSLANALSSNTLTTDQNGSASFSYTAVNSGQDVVTVSGMGIATQFKISVSSVNFAFTTPTQGLDILVGTLERVNVRLLSGGVAVSGSTINFNSTRGSVSATTQTTDANGDASIYVSSTTSGPSAITAQIVNGAQTRLSVNFVASNPATIVLQTNVSTVAPNVAPSTANSVALTAVVRDAMGNPVKNQTVNFNLNPDPSGGSLISGSAVTDSNGTVTNSFIPGGSSTPTDGVTIVATVVNTNIDNSKTLTVNGAALFINFNVSNNIDNLNPSTYSKPFVVQVTDASGAAVPNKTVSLSVYPAYYYKGRLGTSSQRGVAAPGWGVLTSQICPNEDVNRNGILDAGEDANTNGSLTPGGPGIISSPSVTTDSNGQASFNLYYGENVSPWVYFEITATALVAGTESKAKLNYLAVALASDWSDEAVAPAGVSSPYGTILSCTSPN